MGDRMKESVRRAMAPTTAEIAALPLGSNTKAAAELLAAGGGEAIDIGCGEGKFTRALAGRYRRVHGVDVKEKQIAAAQAAAKAEGVDVDFRVASAEALPFADGFFDLVVFSNSLHHMPDPEMALREAARTLKSGALLYVMEPVPSGNYHEATKLVNDETSVRTKAYEAVERLAGAGFSPLSETMYRSTRTFDAFEDWKADQIDRDIKRKALFDARPEDVRARFEGHADRSEGKLSFTQVFRVNLLRKAVA